MRIFLETSGGALCNVGDIAMLQVAIKRLLALWPDAKISVVTSEPERLARFCRNAIPVRGRGRDLFYAPGSVLRSVGRSWPMLERELRVRFPTLAAGWIHWKKSVRGVAASDIKEFLAAISEADIVAATGGGYLTDSFAYHGTCVLDTLLVAHTWGKTIALFGQGIGPVSNPVLAEAIKDTLPRAAVVALREGIGGLHVLQKLQIPTSNVLVTGDDAVELAVAAPGEAGGEGIGINLRIADYAGVSGGVGKEIVKEIVAFGRLASATVHPICISYCPDGNDSVALADAGITGAGGDPPPQPTDVIAQLRSCRLLVTGSYHAAVFALSQGISAVCIAATPYYLAKFQGLQSLFGSGCWVVSAGDGGLLLQLSAVLRDAWAMAPLWCAPLQQAAATQVELGGRAYARLANHLSVTLPREPVA